MAADSRTAAKYGTSIFSLWHQINPARNFDSIAKKPWMRRAVAWASTIKLAEFGHISYFLAPAYIGCGLGCTVAVVRESCDTLALQVPFIPLHLAGLNMLLLFSASSFALLLQSLVKQLLARRRGENQQQPAENPYEVKLLDAAVASFVHLCCVLLLLMWNQWTAVSVALYALPLMMFHFATYRFPSSSAGPPATTTSTSSSSSPHLNNMEKLKNESSSPASASASGTEEAGEPSRVAKLADCMLMAIPTTMGYAGVVGRIDPVVTVPLGIAAISWGAMWHSFGGGNASVFTWRGKKQIKLQQMILIYTSYLMLNVAGYMAGQTLFYYIMLMWAHWHVFGVVDHYRHDDPWSVAVGRRRFRISVWLMFLAVCAGNLVWMMFVGVVAFVQDVEQSDDLKLPAADGTQELLGRQKTSRSGSALSTVLTMNVHPQPHASMEEFSWMERIVKPVLVYASVQHTKKMEKSGGGGGGDGDGTATQPMSSSASLLDDLDIPVCYRREFLGENMVFLMRGSGLVTEEQIKKFETYYFGFVDSYTPFGSI